MNINDLIDELSRYKDLNIDAVVNCYDDILSVRLSSNNKVTINIGRATDDFIKRRLLGLKEYIREKHDHSNVFVDPAYIYSALEDIIEDM